MYCKMRDAVRDPREEKRGEVKLRPRGTRDSVEKTVPVAVGAKQRRRDQVETNSDNTWNSSWLKQHVALWLFWMKCEHMGLCEPNSLIGSDKLSNLYVTKMETNQHALLAPVRNSDSNLSHSKSAAAARKDEVALTNYRGNNDPAVLTREGGFDLVAPSPISLSRSGEGEVVAPREFTAAELKECGQWLPPGPIFADSVK